VVASAQAGKVRLLWHSGLARIRIVPPNPPIVEFCGTSADAWQELGFSVLTER